MFRKAARSGPWAGDNHSAARCCAGTKREDVERGPGAVQAWFGQAAHQVQGRGLHPDQGRGWPSTRRFFTNYRPQFYFRTTDVTGNGAPSRGHRDGDAGRQHHDEVHLIVPIAMEEKLRFAIREGGRTVGAGVVASIIE